MTPEEIRAAIAELRRRRGEARDAQRALIALARSATRDLTAAERTQFDARMAAIEALNGDETRLTALEADETRRLGTQTGPADPTFGSGGGGGDRRSAPWAPGARYAQMFPGQASQGRGDFRDLADFLDGLQHGRQDARYQQARSLGDGSTAVDLMVPAEFVGQIFDQSLEGEVVRPRARPYPMVSNSLTIAGFTAGVGGQPFGISGGWTAQLAEIAEGDPATIALMLNARKLAILTQIGNETLLDGLSIAGASVDEQLSVALPKGLGWLLDKSFLFGTGAGEPVGALGSANPARIVVAKETGQATDSLIYENLAKMFARMHPAHVLNAVWAANPSTIPWLLLLSVPVGTGGSHVPVLQPDGRGGFVILTRPVIFTEKVSALGDEGDIALVDFSQYAVGLRAGLALEKSIHPGFTRDSTYYRAILRADGRPLWPAPYTPDSGPTLSPFVVLGARA